MSPDQIEIPLFPLPNVVLFPSVMLPLHIFEERYKTMINVCINDDAPFGIVLLKGEEETASTIMGYLQERGLVDPIGDISQLQP